MSKPVNDMTNRLTQNANENLKSCIRGFVGWMNENNESDVYLM